MIIKAEKQYIFPLNSVTPSCHASTVLPLKNGRVLAAWFGGKKEKDDDVEIYLSERDENGVWSTPRCLSEGDNVPHWNPVLYRNKMGEIILFYKYGYEIKDWITKFVKSTDEGQSWSEPKELVEGDTSGGRGPVKNKCLLLSNGTLLAPASTEQGKWQCFIDKSYDDGEKWVKCDKMPMPKHNGRNVGLIQPSLWEGENGEVSCFMRSDSGRIYRSDSLDFGETWQKPRRTHLPNNNSGIDCVKDDKGRIWLVYNPVDVNWGLRHPILLSVSQDNGRHFTEILNLEPGNGEFSYPAIVSDGNKLHITYTYKRKQIVYWLISLEN